MTISRTQEDILMTLDQVSQTVEVLQGVVQRLREQMLQQARVPAQQQPQTAQLTPAQDADWGEADVLH